MLNFHGQREFADVIKLKSLRRRDYHGLSRQSNAITRVLIRRRQRISVSSRKYDDESERLE